MLRIYKIILLYQKKSATNPSLRQQNISKACTCLTFCAYLAGINGIYN